MTPYLLATLCALTFGLWLILLLVVPCAIRDMSALKFQNLRDRVVEDIFERRLPDTVEVQEFRHTIEAQARMIHLCTVVNILLLLLFRKMVPPMWEPPVPAGETRPLTPAEASRLDNYRAEFRKLIVRLMLQGSVAGWILSVTAAPLLMVNSIERWVYRPIRRIGIENLALSMAMFNGKQNPHCPA